MIRGLKLWYKKSVNPIPYHYIDKLHEPRLTKPYLIDFRYNFNVFSNWHKCWEAHFIADPTDTPIAQLFPSSFYYKTASTLIQWAIEANNDGDYFPIWGICLGLQVVSNFFANSNRTTDQHSDFRERCRAFDISRPFRPTQVRDIWSLNKF